MSNPQFQFEALVRAHGPELYRVAFWLCRHRELAEDLVQETLLRAWRSIKDLREVSKIKAWLMIILRREHARIYERKQHEQVDIADLEIEDMSATPHAEQLATRELRNALGRLESKYREPLVMQVLGGFSIDEIAQGLDLTPAAVMTQVFRAREKLKVMMNGKEGLNSPEKSA